MIVYVGDTEGKWHRRIHAMGWGRMMVDRVRPVLPGETWAFDNNAFSAWKRGERWDSNAYMGRLKKAMGLDPPPTLAVCPDIVAGGLGSLAFSVNWRVRLPSWPWYLAVQDGMTPADVKPHLEWFDGIFLGGTDAFKLTARQWSDLAHENCLQFHFGRVSSAKRLRMAFDAGADSIDSARILWDAGEFERFHRSLTGLRAQETMAI